MPQELFQINQAAEKGRKWEFKSEALYHFPAAIGKVKCFSSKQYEPN